MRKTVRLVASGCIVAFTLIPVLVLRAGQRKEAAPAPVPTEITSARKVFVANGGEDAHFRGLGLHRSYNQFYAAMKDWKRYDLVGSPAEADAVLEIRLASQLSKYGNELQIVPLLRLAILDPKTHTTLWVFTEELETGGIVGLHQDAKFDKAMDKIVADVKGLTEQAPSQPTPAQP